MPKNISNIIIRAVPLLPIFILCGFLIIQSLPKSDPYTLKNPWITITPKQYEGTFSNTFTINGFFWPPPISGHIPIDNAYGNGSLIISANRPYDTGTDINTTRYNYPAPRKVLSPYYPQFKPHVNGGHYYWTNW